MRKEFTTFATLLLPVIALFSAPPAMAANCDAYPYTTLVNGTTADASQVMGNFNAILSCANTLAPANGPLFTGNVGIGTTPSAWSSFIQSLDINGWGSLYADSTNKNVAYGSNAYYAGSWKFANASNYASILAQTNGTLSFLVSSAASGGAGNAITWTTPLTVLPSGNVGIGTTTPATALDVHDSLGEAYISGSGMLIDRAIAYFGNSQAGQAFRITSDTFSVYNQANTTNKFTVTSSGNVGIGTTSPNMMLSVNGDADKASGGTAWSVFSDKRLKNINGTYDRGLEDIVKLHPIVFRYKKDNPLHLPSANDEVGVVAQDVRTIFPEAVEQGRDGFLEFNMSPVQFAMINAIKQLKTENDRQMAINEAQARETEKLRAENALQKADIASLRAVVTARTEAQVHAEAQQARNADLLRRLDERVDALERSKLIRTSVR